MPSPSREHFTPDTIQHWIQCNDFCNIKLRVTKLPSTCYVRTKKEKLVGGCRKLKDQSLETRHLGQGNLAGKGQGDQITAKVIWGQVWQQLTGGVQCPGTRDLASPINVSFEVPILKGDTAASSFHFLSQQPISLHSCSFFNKYRPALFFPPKLNNV